MKFKFLSKSTEWLGSSPHRTIVVVGNEEGAVIPYTFDKEAINLTDSELFDMAMERMYQENFPERAEKEKFDQFDEAIAEAVKQAVQNRNMLMTISLTFTNFVEFLQEKGIVNLDEIPEEVSTETKEEVAEHEVAIDIIEE